MLRAAVDQSKVESGYCHCGFEIGTLDYTSLAYPSHFPSLYWGLQTLDSGFLGRHQQLTRALCGMALLTGIRIFRSIEL